MRWVPLLTRVLCGCSIFCCCLCYWLGVPLHSSPYSCPECHCVVDVFGDHQVGCGGNGDRIWRHNTIRDAILGAAQSAALPPSKEVPNLILDSLSRPADVFLLTWSCLKERVSIFRIPRHPWSEGEFCSFSINLNIHSSSFILATNARNDGVSVIRLIYST